MAGDNTIPGLATLGSLAKLEHEGKLAASDHDALVALIKHDLKHAENRALADSHKHIVTIPGNIILSRTLNHNELEAVSKVFNTAELLAEILSYLLILQLLTNVSRLSKGFRAAVEGSPRFQRALWRVPSEVEECTVFSFISGFLEACEKSGRLNKPSWEDEGLNWIDIRPHLLSSAMKQSKSLRATQIAQPPIRCMVLEWVDLGNCQLADAKSPIVLQRLGGITFNELIELVDGARLKMAYEWEESAVPCLNFHCYGEVYDENECPSIEELRTVIAKDTPLRFVNRG